MKLAFAIVLLAALSLPVAAQPKPRQRARPARAGTTPAATATAAAAAAARPAGKKKPVFFDFTGDNIDGDRIRPDGTTIFGLRAAHHGSLIELRGDFLHEIVKTAERL